MFVNYRLAYKVLLALAVGVFAVGFLMGSASISRYVSEGGFVSKALPGWVILPLAWCAIIAVEITRRKVDRPIVALRRMLYKDRHWLGRGLLFMLIVLFIARAVTSYKDAIPSYVPFYADPWLADLDRAIFGVDPWRLTHAVIGPIGTVVLDRVYLLWFIVMMIYIGWFCFTRNQVLQVRGLLTYLGAWALLGNIGAMALSSVGPCFYQHFYGIDRFSGLMGTLARIDESHGLVALRAMEFLLDSIGTQRFGVGISAMPSMHTSIAFLCFLVARQYAVSWPPKVLAFAFFLCILVGSVHLGWHYALDGIVSVIATALIWWGSGLFVNWVEAREARAQLLPA